MNKKVVILLAEGFEEIEAITTIDLLRRAGIEVVAAGLADLKVRGAHGIILMADKKLDEVGTSFDACVVPGGMPGTTNLAASEKVKALLKKMQQEGKVIAAICAAPALVLAPLGFLNGKMVTCYPGMQEGLGKTITYREDPVIVDGDVITSRGPATAIAFALAIIEKLSDKETQLRVKKAILG